MKPLTLALVGDVLIDRAEPSSAFDHVRVLLKGVDAAIGSHVGVAARKFDVPAPTQQPLLVEPEMLAGLRNSGLRAMGCANRHMVDGGHAALLETLEHLQQIGVVTAGAGVDLRSARSPAVFEAGGRRIGLLAYTSSFPKGYEARDAVPPIAAVPGVAPLRATTVYEPQVPNMWLPGYEPMTRVVHWPSDLDSLERDVAAAAENVDVLVVTVQQCNPRLGPLGVDEFERVAARRAIDAGANAFFAAHHHSVRGAEIYKGAPVFYGLGNLVFDLPSADRLFAESLLSGDPETGIEQAAGSDDGYASYPFPSYCRNSAVAVLSIGENVRAALIPVEIEPDGRPRPHAPGSDSGRRLAAYLQECMEAVGNGWRLEPTKSFVAGHDALEVVPE